MSEREEQRQGSPLDSERGATTVKDAVVKRIAGRAASEVEGIHMGGNASRTAGGLLGRTTGSSSEETRGVSVEVGRIETAVDLTMAVDYGKDILDVVGRVRERVEEQIRSLTGLRVTELNVTISDIVFPDDGDGGSGRRGELAAGGSSDRGSSDRGSSGGGSEDDTGPVRPREPVNRERSGREDVYVEGTPMEEGETAELRLGEDAQRRPSGERGRGSGRGDRQDRGERGGRGGRGGRRRG